MSKFYAMMPSYRTKGVIPFNRAGQVQLRCFKAKCGRDKVCKAKALTIFNDRKMLEDFSDIKSILNFENWEIADHPQTVHTCGADVAPWHSEKEKFAEEYRKMSLTMDGGNAWDICFSRWDSGLGIEFDQAVLGSKEDYQNRLAYDRKKTQTTNTTTLSIVQK